MISGCRRTGLADVNRRPRGRQGRGGRTRWEWPADRAGGLLIPGGIGGIRRSPPLRQG
ncbi:hypothetical protein STAFG_8252 [Streptomyces afghaniensis 772]|uniref:Uncharacterized protein n=1 Tax=Streptomyces afghaniensis 772 TaxID=1283301 RepID=S4MMN2_9ACTN|nr:hypothetical protein STAFG_8252 [Streptomyces afghaniensis 772]